MSAKQQSPAASGGASREMLGGPSRENSTEPDWRTQLIARRHHVSLPLARVIGAEYFRETSHER